MKGKVLLYVTLFLNGVCLSLKADAPVFGNSPGGGDGFSIVIYNQQCLSGGAVEFTPDQNINLSSITLWLSGYSGQNGQTIYAGIYANNNNPYGNPGTAADYPGSPFLYFTSPAHNDGSLATFTFTDPSGAPYSNPTNSTLLLANTAYWLLVTAGGDPGNYTCSSSWIGGGMPTGNAAYDQSDEYNNGGYDNSSLMPAFTLNAVPEPGFASLTIIPLMLGIARALYKRRKPKS